MRALQLEAAYRNNLGEIIVTDPRVPNLLEAACKASDIALIEAEDLIWIWENRAATNRPALEKIQTIVILSECQLFDVTARLRSRYGLLLRKANGRMPVELLSLAVDGYVAMPHKLLERLAVDQFRIDIVSTLSVEELQILAYVGAALSNRRIAMLSGKAESRVKTLVHLLMRKLRMTNRTGVAVFAVTHGLAYRPEPSESPETAPSQAHSW